MRNNIVLWCFWVWALPMFSVANAAEDNTPFVYQESEAFDHYIMRAKEYVNARKAWVKTEDSANELAAVLPFELLPNPDQCAGKKHIGVLLSHGLSDSPFSMRDPARALQASCYHVRVVLLPGHGTRSSDLLQVTRDDWRATFKHAADSFRQEVDALYVGGFSTGGALAAEYAWKNTDNVAGAILFSPVFKINSSIDWLSPWLALVKDWLDNYPSDDFAKYASIPVPAIAQVYKLAKEARNFILDHPNNLPVFVALSEQDQTVDSSVTEDVFKEGMIGRKSQMVLYSRDQMTANTDRIKVYNSDWPEMRVVGLSHMAVHGAPENPYYGENGEYRVCGWYLSEPALYQACREDKENWFGEASDELTKNSPHAGRVSWNPRFNDLMQEVAFFIQANASNIQ